MESFCALGWDFLHRGWEHLIFVKFFVWDLVLLMICFGCWPLLMIYIIVHSVDVRCLIKCLLSIFSLVWTPISTKLWGFSCFLMRNMFGLLVVCLKHLAPHVHFPCFGHALHITTSCTHLCYSCHALIYTLFLHLGMSCLPYVL